ncbi:PrpF domain-containing protein [Acidaminococcus fermentans]
MRKFPVVYMRGGTSKGCLFHREDLPEDSKEWDEIFLQVMGNPDPKQMDGMGGTVSSNNKIVIIWKSALPNVDIEYLVGQVIVGKKQVDYKSNCGNMTAAVPAYAVEEGMVPIVEPVTTVRMLNKNTDKYINVTVPIDPRTHTFAQEGDCHIAGIDGTAAELKVNFLDPAGAKTGKLLPTGKALDVLEIDGRKIEATILDVSNPLVLVRAEDVGLQGTELPAQVDADKEASALLEKIRGAAAVKMGFARDLEDATAHSPAVPKVGFFTAPVSYTDIAGNQVDAGQMDLCARVISVFKCHKACPLTAASSIAVAAFVQGSIIEKTLGRQPEGRQAIRLGHPSGVMTVYPDLEVREEGNLDVKGVAVQRTARRIMDGTIYIRK